MALPWALPAACSTQRLLDTTPARHNACSTRTHDHTHDRTHDHTHDHTHDLTSSLPGRCHYMSPQSDPVVTPWRHPTFPPEFD
jgi:hypothetical protein